MEVSESYRSLSFERWTCAIGKDTDRNPSGVYSANSTTLHDGESRKGSDLDGRINGNSTYRIRIRLRRLNHCLARRVSANSRTIVFRYRIPTTIRNFPPRFTGFTSQIDDFAGGPGHLRLMQILSLQPTAASSATVRILLSSVGAWLHSPLDRHRR